MGRHVAGVRRGRRDACVDGRDPDALVGERRVVVGVHQVVRDPGMIGILLEQPLENLRRLQLARVGLVVLRRRGLQRQRVIGPRLEVIGVTLRHLLHGPGVGGQPRVQRDRLVVPVVRADRLDPVALTLALRAHRPRLLEDGPGRAGVLQRGRGRQRVPQRGHGQAPVAHRTARVLLNDGVEDLARLGEPVRMQHRDAALELALHLRVTGNRERDLAELVLREPWPRPRERAQENQKRRRDPHKPLPRAARPVHPATQPYQRWLGTAPSSTYAIFIRLR